MAFQLVTIFEAVSAPDWIGFRVVRYERRSAHSSQMMDVVINAVGIERVFDKRRVSDIEMMLIFDTTLNHFTIIIRLSRWIECLSLIYLFQCCFHFQPKLR